MNKKILNDIIALGKEQTNVLLKELNDFYDLNSRKLIESLYKDDLIEAQKIKEAGFSWKDSLTWKKLYIYWVSEDSSPEKIKFISQLVPDELFHDISTSNPLKNFRDIKSTFKEYLSLNLNDRFRANVGDYKLSPYLAQWIYLNRQDSLKNNSVFIERYCTYLGLSELSKMEPLVEDIVKNFSSFAHYLISGCKSQDNINFLLENKTYSEFLFKYNTKHLDVLMSNSMGNNNVEIVQNLVGRGIEFPKDKKSYADLFNTSKELKMMHYVIDNIKDITLGSHVILKTALHHDNPLVEKILQKYTLEQGVDLPLLIKNRSENKGVKLVKSLIFKNGLENNLEDKAIGKSNKI